MTTSRAPVAAGRFYPDDAQALRSMIRGYLDAVPFSGPAPKAIIAPHAGFIYSGPVAASGYAALQQIRGQVQRVVLLGPAHYVPVAGLAAMNADGFATPLGIVPIDNKSVRHILELPEVQAFDAAHAREHSLEVHVPFLQEILGEFRLVPLAVGQVSSMEVSQVLERLWGGPETVIVVSSDLSHFHDYETARRLDEETAQMIEGFHGDKLRGDRACGYVGIGGLLDLAKRHGMRCRRMDLRNSGDTAGPRDKVVGYGCWLFCERQDSGQLDTQDGHTLLDTAEASIARGLTQQQKLTVNPGEYQPALQENRATFVTLKIDGKLRGCMGSLEPSRPLVVDVAHNAYSAAFSDPRFPPLSVGECDELDLHISLLSRPAPLFFNSEKELLALMQPGIDGLTLQAGSRRATLLPAVWEALPEREVFLRHLKIKAGLPQDYWSDDLLVERYTTVSIGRAVRLNFGYSGTKVRKLS